MKQTITHNGKTYKEVKGNTPMRGARVKPSHYVAITKVDGTLTAAIRNLCAQSPYAELVAAYEETAGKLEELSHGKK
jgi:hypothetical protein